MKPTWLDYLADGVLLLGKVLFVLIILVAVLVALSMLALA